MAPVVSIRDFIASKSAVKGVSREATSSTPLWKQRLRTPTTATPVAARKTTGDGQTAEANQQGSSEEPAPIAVNGADAGASDNAKPTDAGDGLKVKLTVIQAPLLPKPELSRPEPPADRAAMLRRLHELRAAGANMLTAQTAPEGGTQGGQTPQAITPVASRGGPTSATPQPVAAWPHASGPLTPQLSPATTPAANRSQFLPASSHLAQTPQTPAAALTPPSAAPGPSPYGAYGARRAVQPYNPPSTPSLAGLRQQELKDTGGGFLTHFADPADLNTPRPVSGALAIGAAGGRGHGYGGAGGGGGAATGRGTPAGLLGAGGGASAVALTPGGSTPMSDIRSIHAVARLQLLRREGAQLVASLGGREG